MDGATGLMWRILPKFSTPNFGQNAIIDEFGLEHRHCLPFPIASIFNRQKIYSSPTRNNAAKSICSTKLLLFVCDETFLFRFLRDSISFRILFAKAKPTRLVTGPFNFQHQIISFVIIRLYNLPHHHHCCRPSLCPHFFFSAFFGFVFTWRR